MASIHTNETPKSEESFVSDFSTDMVFKSRQELMDWVQNVGRSLGYIIVTKRSKSRPNGMISTVALKCDRGGIYRSKTSNSNRTTKRINCPFELKGHYSKMHDFWTLKVVCEKHNHEPAQRMGSHPYARRLSDNETRLVVDLSRKNVKPKDILSTLKEHNSNNVSSLKTLYNARQKFRKAAGKTHTQEEDMGTEFSHPYINEIPSMFHPYITQVQDVTADGNCGFRAIASCLGFHEDKWSTVRSDLLDELDTHEGKYNGIFGNERRLQLHKTLNFFRSDIDAPFEHWMTVPDMGTLIASKYNVILHCLSSRESTTYLPLWSSPPAWYQHIAIAIAHVKDDHYVKVTLKGGYPMPPISSQWVHFRHVCASAWVTPYLNRMNLYIQNYQSD